MFREGQPNPSEAEAFVAQEAAKREISPEDLDNPEKAMEAMTPEEVSDDMIVGQGPDLENDPAAKNIVEAAEKEGWFEDNGDEENTQRAA